jgi:hypothetical protein
MKRKRNLGIECLEERAVPALFGQPWIQPENLTLSFAPDSTQIAGHKSDLFHALSARFPTSQWQGEILSAVQAWASVTDIEIGVVPDQGLPFGTPGMMQGDPRFGDIRIGAQPMSKDAMAVSIPADPYLSGTWSGDILLNDTIVPKLRKGDLYAIMLHEIGHVLGLPENNSPDSVLASHKTQLPTKLSPADVVAVQSLYGIRDFNPPGTITPVPFPTDPTEFDGAAPLVAFGDMARTNDVSLFSLPARQGYTGPITFRVQTAGLSLMQPKISVYDETGRLLLRATSTAQMGASLSVQLKNASPNHTYTIRIEAARRQSFDIGEFSLAVTYDRLNKIPLNQILPVLTGNYRDLPADQIDEIFRHPQDSFLSSEGNLGTTLQTATVLTTTTGQVINSHYHTIGSLNDTGGQRYFKITSPSSNSSGQLVLTAAVNALSVNGLSTRVDLLDSTGKLVASDVLVNDHGTYTFQAKGLAPSSTYYLRVAASGHGGDVTGNFLLVADFLQTPQLLTTFASNSLDALKMADNASLFVARTQLFQFVFTAESISNASAQMIITDAKGNVVFTLTTVPGSPASTNSLFLSPGQYNVRITSVGVPTSPLLYRVRAVVISDPIGPVVADPTMAPLYTSPTVPNQFVFPIPPTNNSPPAFVLSYFPYYWLNLSL